MPGSRSHPLLVLALCLGLALAGCTAQPPADTSRLPATADPSYDRTVDDPAQVRELTDEPDPASGLRLPKGYGLEPIVRPETHPITDAEAAALTAWTITNASACAAAGPTRPRCEYDFVLDPLPSGVGVGSVLVSGPHKLAPAGFLAKVTALAGTHGQAVEATLGDAVEQGEFRGIQQMDPAQAVDVKLEPGVTRSPSFGRAGGLRPPREASSAAGFLGAAPGVFPQNVGSTYAYDVDVHEYGLHVAGHLDFSASCGVSAGLTYKWKVIPNGAYFIAGCGMDQSLAVDVSVETEKEVETIELAVVDLGTITFFIGPVPVVIVFKMHIYAELDGTIIAGVSYGASEQAHAAVSIGYHKGWVSQADFTATAEKHQVLTGPQIDLSAVVGADVRGMVYGINGSGTGAQSGLAITGKPLSKPIWCLKIIGTLTASLMSLDLGIKTFTWGPSKLKSVDFPVACAENSAPTIVLGYPKDGDAISLGGGIGQGPLTAHGSDPEDGLLPVTWTSDRDGLLGTTTLAGSQLTKGLTTPGAHLLTLTTTDLDGKSATVQLHVTVTTPKWGLSAKLYDHAMKELPRNGVTGYTGQTVYVKAVPRPPAGSMQPTCAQVAWSAPGLPLATMDDCLRSVVLPAPGQYPVTLQISPPWGGSPITDQLVLTVTKPPAVVAPEVGFTARGAGDRYLTDGSWFRQAETLTFAAVYTNAAAAKTALSYGWSVAIDGGRAQRLDGGSDTATTSVRTYSLNQQKVTHTVVVTCTVRNASSSAVVTTFRMTLKYQGSPA